jgi:ubiquinone/menaquinone biosynthesis C-methylase UbiE
MDEIDRIANDYINKEEKRSKIWTFFNPVNLYLIHEREKKLLWQLNKLQITDLANLKILDLGCGFGAEIARFIYYGAEPANLFGIDLLDYRINKAKENFPSITFIKGDASALPFENNSFDIIIQMTVFSSIRDTGLKLKIATELERVLVPGGLLIWYDILPVSWFARKMNRICELIVILIKDPKYFFAKLKSKLKKSDVSDQDESQGNYRIAVKEISRPEVINMFKNSKLIYSEKVGIIYSILELALKIPLLLPLFNVITSFKSHDLLILKKGSNNYV